MNWTVGPLPPAVYWRRRAVIVVPLLLLLILLATCVAKSSGSNEDNTQRRSNKTPAVTPSDISPEKFNIPSKHPDCSEHNPCEPTSEDASDRKNSPNTSEQQANGKVASSASPNSANGETVECSDADLAINISVSHHRFSVGSRFRIDFIITNNTDHPCIRDVGAGPQEIYIRAGDERVWSSDHCSADRSEFRRVLAPKQPQTYWASWWTQRSSDGCPTDLGNVGVGDYQIYGRLGSMTSEVVTITLE